KANRATSATGRDLLERFHRASPAQRKAMFDRLPENEDYLHKVQRGDVVLTVVERGTLEPVNARSVTCRVRARAQGGGAATTIKWLVEQGSFVKKGQLVVELDDSALQEQLKTQQVTVDDRKAQLAQAENELKIAQIQNDRDLKVAEGDVETAEIDLSKFESVYKAHQRKLEIKVDQAKRSLENAKRPQQPAADVDTLRGNVEIAEIDLKNHRDENAAQKRRLEIKLEQAKQNLEIVKLQIAGRRAQA